MLTWASELPFLMVIEVALDQLQILLRVSIFFGLNMIATNSNYHELNGYNFLLNFVVLRQVDCQEMWS